jgi:D-alanyl-D-alanine dipeptidase
MNIAFAVKKCVQQPVGAGLGAALVLLACSASAKDTSWPTVEQERLIATECVTLLEDARTRHALQMVKVLVQSQGMQLVLQACPYVRTHPGTLQQVLDVRVRVVDSETAAHFVRGPLADGEEVDMGDVHLGLPEYVTAQEPDVAPDVQFNRGWLAAVMQGRGWQAVPGHWWAFVPAPSTK